MEYKMNTLFYIFKPTLMMDKLKIKHFYYAQEAFRNTGLSHLCS